MLLYFLNCQRFYLVDIETCRKVKIDLLAVRHYHRRFVAIDKMILYRFVIPNSIDQRCRADGSVVRNVPDISL